VSIFRLLGIVIAAVALALPGTAHAENNRRLSGAGRATTRAPAATGRSRRERRSGARKCLARPVLFERVNGRPRESARISLTTCRGWPNLDALERLSILARPRSAKRPHPAEVLAYRRAAKKSHRSMVRYVAKGIRRLNPRLLTRLQRIANRWPGRPIEIVSGYRPRARRTSRHRHGNALDIRLPGVSKRQLSEFARSFEKTGVGYYPNSVFIHIDVREKRAYWVDRSGPGEPPDYGPWPPTPRRIKPKPRPAVAAARKKHTTETRLSPTLKAALRQLEDLIAETGEIGNAHAKNSRKRPSKAAASAESAEPSAEAQPPSDDELRALARRALVVVHDRGQTAAAGPKAGQRLPTRTTP
jgi:hypothetical protein